MHKSVVCRKTNPGIETVQQAGESRGQPPTIKEATNLLAVIGFLLCPGKSSRKALASQ